jgi:hypothetical protein
VIYTLVGIGILFFLLWRITRNAIV